MSNSWKARIPSWSSVSAHASKFGENLHNTMDSCPFYDEISRSAITTNICDTKFEAWIEDIEALSKATKEARILAFQQKFRFGEKVQVEVDRVVIEAKLIGSDSRGATVQTRRETETGRFKTLKRIVKLSKVSKTYAKVG